MSDPIRWQPEGFNLREWRGEERHQDACHRMVQVWEEQKSFLDLSGLKLTSFSEEIGKFTFLKTVDVSNNLLDELPDELGNCSSLTSLNVSHNLLTDLPLSLGALQQLQRLNLSFNHFIAIPLHLANLSRNCQIEVRKNHLQRNDLETFCREVEWVRQRFPEKGPDLLLQGKKIEILSKKTHA